jgi:hypothetical protein
MTRPIARISASIAALGSAAVSNISCEMNLPLASESATVV